MEMQRTTLAALAVALSLSACAQAQQQRSGIEGVSDAMGATKKVFVDLNVSELSNPLKTDPNP
jgi:nitrous oxide reductase accessory protein NosL